MTEATKQTETTTVPNDCMSSKRTAQYLDAAEQTLNNWRHQGRGPSYIKIGKKILYRRSDVDAWLDAHRVKLGA